MSTLELCINILNLLALIPKAYYLSPNRFTHESAKLFCSDWCGSSLASIHSHFQNEEAIAIIKRQDTINEDQNIWMGLENITISATTINASWIDGTSLNYGSAQNIKPWSTGQPNQEMSCSTFDHLTYEWDDKECDISWYKIRLLCNHCDGVINKYVVSKDGYSWEAAKEYCENSIGTTLASIHSERDNEEAISLSKLSGHNNYWWFGLNDVQDQRIFVYTDETTFDYGTNISGGVYPWLLRRPDGTDTYLTDQNYVRIQRDENNHYPGKIMYVWNDENNYESSQVLCNKPSELCQSVNIWNILRGSSSFIQFSECEMHCQNSVGDTFAVIDDKQWYNGNNVLVIEYYFYFEPYNNSGRAGILLYNSLNGSFCNRYYAGLKFENGSMRAVLTHSENNLSRPIQSVIIDVSTQHSYLLSVSVKDGTAFNISINDNHVLQAKDLMNQGNVLIDGTSGYIGVTSFRSRVDGKSLYVSGYPIYLDNNTMDTTEDCTTLQPTTNPTFNPTDTPSNFPSSVPTDAPTLLPSQLPSTNPTSTSSEQPSSIPSTMPTSHPSERPSTSPTKWNISFTDYGVKITVTFQYSFQKNTTEIIISILDKLSRELVNKTIDRDCQMSADYDTKQYIKDNKTIITSTILVCNEEAQLQLLTVIEMDESTLQKDLVNDINKQTNLNTGDNFIHITGQIIYKQQFGQTSTTDSLPNTTSKNISQ